MAPLLIAMKGHPGSGKSTIARSLASLLKIPLIDKDDVRDCTLSLHSSTPTSLLNDLSYDVVFQIAATQLRLGLDVVVDSPLSRETHLLRLRQIASSAGARVVIVECKPKDEGEWRRRLERRGASDEAGWHKPATWQDLQRLMEGYSGCTDYDAGDLPKTVVDTTGGVGVEEIVSSVVEFIVTNGGDGLDCRQKTGSILTRGESSVDRAR